MIGLSAHLDNRLILTKETKALKAVMRAAGGEIAALARALIRRSAGGGRVYYRNGRRYTASAPGQAPVKVSGALAAGIKVRPFKSGTGVAIRETEFYGVMLEGGAKGGGGGKGARNKAGRGDKRGRRSMPTTTRVMLPRPFLSTAIKMREASLGERIRDAIVNDIKFKRIKA